MEQGLVSITNGAKRYELLGREILHINPYGGGTYPVGIKEGAHVLKLDYGMLSLALEFYRADEGFDPRSVKLPYIAIPTNHPVAVRFPTFCWVAGKGRLKPDYGEPKFIYRW